jgi:hypothetical protein
MDRFLNFCPDRRETGKGGARWALPFFFVAALCAALAASALADDASVPPEDPNLDAGVRVLQSSGGTSLNALAADVGFPGVGKTWWLAGGGATLTPGALRVQVAAWQGSLQSTAGPLSTYWGLTLADVTVEQRYPYGSFLFTAGTSLEVAQLVGDFAEYNGLTGVDAPLYGTSAQLGVRWPAGTKLGFFLRGGWEWLTGRGAWRGTLAPQLGTTEFSLGGLTGTLQLELSY